DEIMGEIDHEYADVRVLQDIAQARHHAIAPELGVGDGTLIEHPQETGRPGPEAAVAFAGRVARGDERHLHAPDELDHLGRQLVPELVVIELAGPLPRAVPLLQDVLALRSGPRPPVAASAAPRASPREAEHFHCFRPMETSPAARSICSTFVCYQPGRSSCTRVDACLAPQVTAQAGGRPQHAGCRTAWPVTGLESPSGGDARVGTCP